jgi:hypothetical protein
MGDGEGESDSYGRVDGVATGFHDRDADVGSERFLGDHHGGARADGVPREQAWEEKGSAQDSQTLHKIRF